MIYVMRRKEGIKEGSEQARKKGRERKGKEGRKIRKEGEK